MTELTPELLKEWLSYNPETGTFTWKKHTQPYKVGKEAGIINGGYAVISFPPTKTQYRAHRLAWFYAYGKWPEYQIDHINRDKTDNSIQNLRDVSHSVNMRNRDTLISNSTGFTGVAYQKRYKKPFQATITVNGRTKHLGYFETPEEASEAYQKAKNTLLPEKENVYNQQ